MFRRILVTLDGSTFGESALPVASRLARTSRGEVRLLSVLDSGWAGIEGGRLHTVPDKARRYLDRIRMGLEPSVAAVSVDVREGVAEDEILQAAEEFDAGVTVMATHGRAPFSRFWLGSVADRCVRRGHRPMLLVRPQTGVADGSFDVRRVVVPLNGSDLAEKALAPALELARLCRSAIALVRVVPEHAMFETAFIPATQATNVDMLEYARLDGAAYLTRVSERISQSGAAATTRVAVDDYVARAILAHAAGDMIVIATHARTGLDRTFLGSVADTIVRSATGPVLVIPPDRADAAPQAVRELRRAGIPPSRTAPW